MRWTAVMVLVLMASGFGGRASALAQEPPLGGGVIVDESNESGPSLGADQPEAQSDFGRESNALGDARRQDAVVRQGGLVRGPVRLAGWRRRAMMASPWSPPVGGIPFAPPAPPWVAGPWGPGSAMGPWSMFPSGPWGAGYVNPARQPIGHEIRDNGRGGYTYRPLYEDETVVIPAEPQPKEIAPREPTPSSQEPTLAPRREAPKPAPEQVTPEELPPGNREPVDL